MPAQPLLFRARMCARTHAPALAECPEGPGGCGGDLGAEGGCGGAEGGPAGCPRWAVGCAVWWMVVVDGDGGGGGAVCGAVWWMCALGSPRWGRLPEGRPAPACMHAFMGCSAGRGAASRMPPSARSWPAPPHLQWAAAADGVRGAPLGALGEGYPGCLRQRSLMREFEGVGCRCRLLPVQDM